MNNHIQSKDAPAEGAEARAATPAILGHHPPLVEHQVLGIH